jgi:two-component system response regulator AlgR
MDLIEDSLRALESELGPRFVRVHRGALANRDFIEAIERTDDGTHQIRLRGVDDALPVSRRLAGDLKTQL